VGEKLGGGIRSRNPDLVKGDECKREANLKKITKRNGKKGERELSNCS